MSGKMNCPRSGPSDFSEQAKASGRGYSIFDYDYDYDYIMAPQRLFTRLFIPRLFTSYRRLPQATGE